MGRKQLFGQGALVVLLIAALGAASSVVADLDGPFAGSSVLINLSSADFVSNCIGRNGDVTTTSYGDVKVALGGMQILQLPVPSNGAICDFQAVYDGKNYKQQISVWVNSENYWSPFSPLPCGKVCTWHVRDGAFYVLDVNFNEYKYYASWIEA